MTKATGDVPDTLQERIEELPRVIEVGEAVKLCIVGFVVGFGLSGHRYAAGNG